MVNKLMKNRNNNLKTNNAVKNNAFVINKSKTISPEINVIGLNVEEANQIIDKSKFSHIIMLLFRPF